MVNHSHHSNPAGEVVAQRLRELRNRKGLSLRVLAELSGLSINTLSLIENEKSSPSVSTLQQLARALNEPVAAFFESESSKKQVVYTPADKGPHTDLGGTQMQNLGKDLAGNMVQPFFVTLKPGMGSGDRMIVHTGHEFVYCLQGTIRYEINEKIYSLSQGDSLVFEAHLPHRWVNDGKGIAHILLLLYPSDQREQLGGRHFSLDYFKKELTMKIAFITEDGKTISQHFGRAPFYLVLSIEAGKIVNREMREKMGHNQFHNQAHSADYHGAGHGMDVASHNKHLSMADSIADCEVVICGGMGMGAYESLRTMKIQPLLTDVSDIDSAAQAFIEGKLIDHKELLHKQ